MRGLSILALFSAGCSLIFDGSDLHGTRDLSAGSSDMAAPPGSDLATGGGGDMMHGLAFGPSTVTSIGAHGTDIAVAHFNTGKSPLDVALVAHSANMVYILSGAGDGTFPSMKSHAACATTGTVSVGKPYNLVAADFDADGNVDVAFTCNDSSAGQDGVTVMLGDGAGGFKTSGGTSFNAGTAHAAGSSGNVLNAVALATGDFDDNGKIDLAVGYNQDPTFDVFLNAGTSPLGFGSKNTQSVGTSSQIGSGGLFAADLNGDGATDVGLADFLGAVINKASKPWDPSAGNPFAATTYFPNMGGAGTVSLWPLTKGGRPDLLVVMFDNVAMQPGNVIQVLRNDNDGNFPGTPTMVTADPSTSYIAVADFDGDGLPDIAFNSSDLGHVGIALQNADHSFRTAVTFPCSMGITGLVAADFNGDGRPDLALPTATDSGVDILLNQTP